MTSQVANLDFSSEQVYGTRSSSRSGSRRAGERNVKLSESTSRRTSRSEALDTPTSSKTSAHPRRRKITDYMDRIYSNAEPLPIEVTKGSYGAQLPANGLNTPKEGPSSPVLTDHAPPLEVSSHEPVLTPTSLSVEALNVSKQPWDNDPMAIAIWVTQKVQNANSRMSSTPTCALSGCQVSGSFMIRGSDTPGTRDRVGSEEHDVFENERRRSSRRRKQLDTFMNIEEKEDTEVHELGFAGKSKEDKRRRRSEADLEGMASLDQLLRQLVERVAPKLKKLKPFTPGYGDWYFNSKAEDPRALSQDAVAAGKLLFNVLPVLQSPQSRQMYQAAADALICLLNSGTSNSPRFLEEAIEAMAQDPELLLGTSIINKQSGVGDLFLDIDASLRHNNDRSPSPNIDDDVNRTPPVLSKTENIHSNPNFTVDSLASSFETHSSSFPLKNDPPFSSQPSQLTSTHPTSPHFNATHISSTDIFSARPLFSQLTSSNPVSIRGDYNLPRTYSLSKHQDKGSFSRSGSFGNQSPDLPTSFTSLRTPPNNQAHSCSTPDEEHSSSYPHSFESSHETPLDINTHTFSSSLVYSSSQNTPHKHSLVCSSLSRERRPSQPIPNLPLEKHPTVNTELVADSCSGRPYESSLKNIPQEHNLVCSSLNPLTQPLSNPPVEKLTIDSELPADPLSGRPLHKSPLKSSSGKSCLNDLESIRASCPNISPHPSSLINTPEKHSLVGPESIEGPISDPSFNSSLKITSKKHNPVDYKSIANPSSSNSHLSFLDDNTSQKHNLVSPELSQALAFTNSRYDSLETPSDTNWPAESAIAFGPSQHSRSEKHSVVPSSGKDKNSSHKHSNSTPKHRLVNPTSIKRPKSAHPHCENFSEITFKKHSLVNPQLTPLPYSTPKIHTLVNHTQATDSSSIDFPSDSSSHETTQIHSLVDPGRVRDHNSPQFPPLSFSLRQTSEKPTPLDKSPPGQHLQEPPSPSESTEKMVRASTRARKPTERALEAAATAAASKRKAKKPAPTKAAAAPAKEEAGTKPSEDEVLVARLLELAAAAVAPGFIPEQEVNVDELRKEFYDNLAREERGQDGEIAGRAPTSDGSGVARSPAVLDHPTADRPWTDADGWTHTGQLNEHGEEFVQVPNTYVWYRPNNTFNDPLLPPPRPRMKSVAQLERDRVFGFPPLLGERNLPAGDPRPRKRSREEMEAGPCPPPAEEGGSRKKTKTNGPALANTTTSTSATTADSDPAKTSAPAPEPTATNTTASKRGVRSRAAKKELPAPSRASTRTRVARGAKGDNV